MTVSRRGGAAAKALAAIAVLALAVLAAGCGSGNGIEGSSNVAKTVAIEGKPTGSMTFSNWPLYIDKATVPDFEKATGVSVKYIEDINSNEEFFAKMQPILAKGEAGGRSLFVVTSWMASKMRALGYLQNFDKSAIPNVEKNLRPSLRHPGFDPNRTFTAPWQTSMTGIIVNKELAPEAHSTCDLFNPKYKGKVEVLNEFPVVVPMVMKCMGINTEHATEADWKAAIQKLKGAAESGQIRRFTGNDYAADLTNGNAALVMGWSGDAVQLQGDNPNIEWRMPTDGCILLEDEMVIPVGAPNPTAAEAFMNYVYDPAHQAQIEDYVNYVSPVEGVKGVLEKTDPKVARNPLVFPTNSFLKQCTAPPKLSAEEEQSLLREFDAVLNG